MGYNVCQWKIIPIDRNIEFASKFSDEIKEKTQLQRFLGNLNYIGEYYKKIAQDFAPLYERLKKNPPPWSERHTKVVIATPKWQKIVETDASNIEYGGILKQYDSVTSKEELVRFTSGTYEYGVIHKHGRRYMEEYGTCHFQYREFFFIL